MSESKPADSTPSEVVSNADQPVTTPKKKSGGSKMWIIIVLVVLALCCISSLVGAGIWTFGYLGTLNNSNSQTQVEDQVDDNNQNVDDTTDSDLPPTDDSNDTSSDNGADMLNDFFAIGTSFEVRVDRVNRNGDDVEISLSVKNDSQDTQTFSTILYLSLVSNTNSEGYSQNFFSQRYQQDGAQLDGEIAAGETDRGVVVYRVDDNPSSLTLRVSEGLFSDSYVEIPIN